MKKIALFILDFIFISFFYSCSSEPNVTRLDNLTAEEPEYVTDYYGRISFKGTKKVSKGWLHWDDNKECPHSNGYSFRILKNTPTRILKSDKCDHCHYSWDLHDDM